MKTMLMHFSRIATYAIVLSCCFVTYSCNEGEIRELKQQITELENKVYNKQNDKTQTQSTQPTPRISRPSSGYINGHEYVDLGLSVVWATCNVGASSPSGYGNYYAWGETWTKSTYTYNNCTTWEKDMGDIAGDSRYDAARANWGGTWRLPTKEEILELRDKCKGTWTTQGGHYVYKITGPNGNSIFLPAAGWRDEGLEFLGDGGWYWSSLPQENNTMGAYFFRLGSEFYWGWSGRWGGLSVRPVSD